MKCPFSNNECNNDCALFIAPDDINENVRSRLNAIGVFDKEKGLCSLKGLALSGTRFMYEKTSTFSRS